MIKELIISLVILAGSIILYCTLGWLEDPRAATFPRIIILIMGALAVAIDSEHSYEREEGKIGAQQQTSITCKTGSAGGTAFPSGRWSPVFF